MPTGRISGQGSDDPPDSPGRSGRTAAADRARACPSACRLSRVHRGRAGALGGAVTTTSSLAPGPGRGRWVQVGRDHRDAVIARSSRPGRRAGGDSGVGKYLVEVAAHGAVGRVELLGDLLVGASGHGKVGDLRFLGREPGESDSRRTALPVSLSSRPTRSAHSHAPRSSKICSAVDSAFRPRWAFSLCAIAHRGRGPLAHAHRASR